jgi:segregation and condensation protein B
MDNLDKILEGILFLSGDGIDRGTIMEKLQVTPKELDKAIDILKKRYNEDSGINFITYKDKLQLCGNPKFADDVSVVLNPIRERQLTRATLEVMAIVAYKQPVTRLDVQDIRGMNSDYALQTLLNYKLIEVVGRKDAVGKPLLFGTTDLFLRHFGIDSLNELPDYDEIMKDVEIIKNENNYLYNEFEIPDDEQDDNLTENEKEQPKQEIKEKNDLQEVADKIDVEKIVENKETDLSNRTNTKEENLANASEAKEMEQKINEHITENKNGISKFDDDTPLEDLIDNSYGEDSSISGIDYSLLDDNTDIEK